MCVRYLNDTKLTTLKAEEKDTLPANQTLIFSTKNYLFLIFVRYKLLSFYGFKNIEYGISQKTALFMTFAFEKECDYSICKTGAL